MNRRIVLQIALLRLIFYTCLGQAAANIPNFKEVIVFDANANQKEYEGSFFSFNLQKFIFKVSQKNLLTVIEVDATSAKVKSAVQSSRTVGIYFGGHGTPSGKIVDGEGHALPQDTFVDKVSSSLSVVACMACMGEKITEVYPVSSNTTFLHGQGILYGFQVSGFLRNFPNYLQPNDLTTQGLIPETSNSLYPNGDLYVIEENSSVSEDSMLSETFINAFISGAVKGGLRILFFSGASYQQAIEYALSQPRTAGVLLNGPEMNLTSKSLVMYAPKEFKNLSKIPFYTTDERTNDKGIRKFSDYFFGYLKKNSRIEVVDTYISNLSSIGHR